MFHRYTIVDNQDVADAMEMLEKSQDQQAAAIGRDAKGNGEPF